MASKPKVPIQGGFPESYGGDHRAGNLSPVWTSHILFIVSHHVCPFLLWNHGPDFPRTSSSDLASSLGMDPSRRYPLWYKNTVSLWILFGMAWLALIIKLILSLMETPGRSCSCYHHNCKGDFKPRGWRQGPDEEAETHSPQPGCYPERPVETTQHPEPSTQVSCCRNNS